MKKPWNVIKMRFGAFSFVCFPERNNRQYRKKIKLFLWMLIFLFNQCFTTFWGGYVIFKNF
jgi:hypothetical protein